MYIGVGKVSLIGYLGCNFLRVVQKENSSLSSLLDLISLKNYLAKAALNAFKQRSRAYA